MLRLRLLQDLAPYHRDVNVNAEILAMYTEHLLPEITEPGDDNNYGSAATLDVHCLQASLPTSSGLSKVWLCSRPD